LLFTSLFTQTRQKHLHNTSYAIVDPAGNFASGRAEVTRSFPKKFAQSANFLGKEETCHAAAGEDGFHLAKRAG